MTKKENPKRFGLLGKNIDYSFSRNYFSTKFSNENLVNHSYVNFDLASLEGFEQLLTNELHLYGLNVTIPYKKEVIPFLDHISDESKAIGAVNTIVWDHKGRTTGHNTDHIGFKKVLLEKMESIPKKALILGTGGASSAVKFALESLNCEVIFVSRTAKKNQLTYGELDQSVIANTQLIVNTTPLGTFPNINEAPSIPYELLNSNHFLFDLIYNPSETLFMKKAKLQGSQVINGHQMLIYQAEKSWELWNQ
ncbi:shikimate dehydrogenase [Flavobacteriaceae bacterium]|nr:shikimate dehydrogenase [Flavobacteriaceae bacterium]MDB3862813.1 shikimate dehydrogenase [Flavobacteriaceae bacterium]MDC3354537.1 shikimate dehydrogenase [Flavobacteriaceae bacterium]